MRGMAHIQYRLVQLSGISVAICAEPPIKKRNGGKEAFRKTGPGVSYQPDIFQSVCCWIIIAQGVSQNGDKRHPLSLAFASGDRVEIAPQCNNFRTTRYRKYMPLIR